MNRLPLLLTFWIGLVLAGCGGAAPAASSSGAGGQASVSLPQAVAALVPDAKKEGTASIFGQTVDPQQVKAFEQAVSEFYGFAVKLEMVSGLHPTKAAEVVQTTKQGVPSGIDLFWTASNVAATLQSGGTLAALDWIKELGLDSSLKFGDHGLRTFDGTLALVTYNTQQVSANDAPKGYEDLANPRWKGRIVMPRSGAFFSFVTHALGEDKVTALATDMVQKQSVTIVPTYPDVRGRVASGEFVLGLGIDAIRDARRGAPVEMAPIDPFIVTPWGVHLMKDAKHPNMAKLVGYWMTTAAGQKALDEINALSLASAQGTSMWKAAQGKKIDVIGPEFNQESDRLTKKYSELFGIQ
ncbi:MAG TPA: ABC transporter substrate-binding protein [Chloroflexota bacterium]|nr:ABC transporter substrate-binding protein [Chloroflexota bacterium]